MKEKIKYVLNCISDVFAIIILTGLVLFLVFAIRSCDYKPYVEVEVYTAYYGNFATGQNYKFTTYDRDGSHYTLYDHNKNVVADFVLSGNNTFQMNRLK